MNLVRAIAGTGSRPGLLLTQTVSSLPGFQSELEEAVGSEAVVLASGAAATGALRLQHLLVRARGSGSGLRRRAAESSLVAAGPASPRNRVQKHLWRCLGDEDKAPDSSALRRSSPPHRRRSSSPRRCHTHRRKRSRSDRTHGGCLAPPLLVVGSRRRGDRRGPQHIREFSQRQPHRRQGRSGGR